MIHLRQHLRQNQLMMKPLFNATLKLSLWLFNQSTVLGHNNSVDFLRKPSILCFMDDFFCTSRLLVGPGIGCLSSCSNTVLGCKEKVCAMSLSDALARDGLCAPAWLQPALCCHITPSQEGDQTHLFMHCWLCQRPSLQPLKQLWPSSSH